MALAAIPFKVCPRVWGVGHGVGVIFCLPVAYTKAPSFFFCTYAISGNCGSSGGGKGGGEQGVTVLLFNEKFGRMNN